MQSSLIKSDVFIGEIVDTVVESVEPIDMGITLIFVVPIQDIYSELNTMLINFSNRIVAEIKNHKHRAVVPIQRYAKTAHAAAYLDVDPTFLTQRQDSVFIEGIHYFKPENSTIKRWDLETLEEWMRTSSMEVSNDEILDNMFT